MPAISELYRIGNFIDTFALGHYARVFDAVDLRNGRTVALKVMRPEHTEHDAAPRWEAQAFPHEVDLLTRLSEHSVPMRYYDCGYLSSESEYPAQGDIISFGQNLSAFREALYTYNAQGWRPYIALEHLPRQNNLLYLLMQPTQQQTSTQRRRLPTEEGIDLAMQFGHMLHQAHTKGIFYLDHKLEHIYWDGTALRIIDWNSSKLLEGSRQGIEQYRRKDIHNLCVGVLYPIFTGLAPQRTGLRPQPAGMSDVDARYTDINHLDFTTEPTLSQPLTELLEAGAREDLTNADQFLKGLEQVAIQFGWHFPLERFDPALTQARGHMRDALHKLREGETKAREALELLLEAATIEDISDDLDSELRRLMKGVNDFLNARVIP